MVSLHRGIVPLVLCSVFTSAHAFKVAFVSVNGVTAMGAPYHEIITESALTGLEISLSFGKKVSFDLNNASLVALANAETDSEFWDIPLVHFDNERLVQASNRLISLRAAVVARAMTGDYAGSRRLLGQALHTVQDFYAHSTWVDRGETGLAPLGRQVLASPNPQTQNCTIGSIMAGAPLSSGYFNLSQVIPSLLFWTNQYVSLGIEPTWPNSKCIHGGSSGAGIHKDDPSKGALFTTAANQAINATRQYTTDIVDDLRKLPPEDADKAICGLVGVDPKNCKAVDFYVSFNSRSAYIVETGMPSYFPAVLGATIVELASRGLVPGDVIEMRSAGAYRHSGYWGNPALAYGSTAVFFGGGSYLAQASLTAADPGTSPPVFPHLTGTCPDNAAFDNPYDFNVQHAEFRRVKIPPGATHFALSVPDCFHGDNIGTMTVNVRRVPPIKASTKPSFDGLLLDATFNQNGTVVYGVFSNEPYNTWVDYCVVSDSPQLEPFLRHQRSCGAVVVNQDQSAPLTDQTASMGYFSRSYDWSISYTVSFPDGTSSTRSVSIPRRL